MPSPFQRFARTWITYISIFSRLRKYTVDPEVIGYLEKGEGSLLCK